MLVVNIHISASYHGHPGRTKEFMALVGPNLSRCCQLTISVDNPRSAEEMLPLEYDATELRDFKL